MVHNQVEMPQQRLEEALAGYEAAITPEGRTAARARINYWRERLEEAGRVIDWDPSLHPRNRMGEFVDVLSKLKAGTGVRVKGTDRIITRREGGHYRYYHPGDKANTKDFTIPEAAAVQAMKGTDELARLQKRQREEVPSVDEGYVKKNHPELLKDVQRYNKLRQTAVTDAQMDKLVELRKKFEAADSAKKAPREVDKQGQPVDFHPGYGGDLGASIELARANIERYGKAEAFGENPLETATDAELDAFVDRWSKPGARGLGNEKLGKAVALEMNKRAQKRRDVEQARAEYEEYDKKYRRAVLADLPVHGKKLTPEEFDRAREGFPIPDGPPAKWTDEQLAAFMDHWSGGAAMYGPEDVARRVAGEMNKRAQKRRQAGPPREVDKQGQPVDFHPGHGEKKPLSREEVKRRAPDMDKLKRDAEKRVASAQKVRSELRGPKGEVERKNKKIAGRGPKPRKQGKYDRDLKEADSKGDHGYLAKPCPDCGKKHKKGKCKALGEALVEAIEAIEISREERYAILDLTKNPEPLEEARYNDRAWTAALNGYLEEVSSRAYPDLERKPGKQNWVDRAGGLPSYIERIAKHLHYEKGMTISHAIATAVNTVKRWCQGGTVSSTSGPTKSQNVSAKTKALACKAVAQWNAKRAKSSAD